MDTQHYLDAIDAGIALYRRTLARARGLELHTGDVEYVLSRPPGGPERIFRVRLSPATAEQRIGEIVAAIRAGAMPDTLLLGPNTTPADLAARLARHGFAIDASTPCMALDLADQDADQDGDKHQDRDEHSHPHADRYPDEHPDRYADDHAHRHAHEYADEHAYRYTHEYADEHTYRHAHEYPDEHADGYAHEYADGHANQHPNGYPNQYADEYSDRHAHEHADQHADEHTHKHADQHTGRLAGYGASEPRRSRWHGA